MDSFVIRSASGGGSLTFFERTPTDSGRAIERFKVRFTDLEVSAVGRVYSDESASHPSDLFAQMAANWRGWQGALVWESPLGEMSLRSTQDQTGHVAIQIELRSGFTQSDWTIQTTIETEAGQLDTLATEAERFFGS